MPKVCIHCGLVVTDESGEAVTKLYDEKLYKKSRIIKLVQCPHCGRVCDKYLEYDGTLLLLDAALQSKPALRHFLINEDHSATIRKVSLLTLIVEGYCRSDIYIATLSSIVLHVAGGQGTTVRRDSSLSKSLSFTPG